MRPKRHPRRAATRGLGLVEALIALALIAFGALSLLGLQQSLHLHAEVARQRSEATALAQSQLEALRAYGSLQARAGHVAWTDLASGTDQPAFDGNTVFQRDWEVLDDDAQLARRLRVRVSWASRADDEAAQSVELLSLVARTDPQDVARLLLPAPQADPFRRALDRPAAVPLDARSLQGRHRGRSTLAWTGARGGHLVLHELDGSVIAHCALPPGDDTDLDAACTRWSAVLLEGYLSGALPAAWPQPAFDRMEHLRADPAGDCVLEPVFDRHAGQSLPGLLRYRCLMQAGDDDQDDSTPPVWSARLRWAGLPQGVWSCRYTGAGPTLDPQTATYTRIGSTLTQQNYRLIEGGDCPAGSLPHPRG